MIEELRSKNIIQCGEFKLKSGDTSNIYINLKNIISYPDLHLKLCNEIANKIIPNIDLICGTPYGAVPFASYISITNNISMIFLTLFIFDVYLSTFTIHPMPKRSVHLPKCPHSRSLNSWCT